MHRAQTDVLPVLGELESSVLEYLWEHDEVDVKDVHRDLGIARGISVSTVQSTLERLHRKQLAERKRVGRAYRYTSSTTRDEFRARAAMERVGSLHGAHAHGVLAAFVDLAAAADKKNLDRLEAIISAARTKKALR